MSKAKEAELLRVLEYPGTPLHNNTAEIAVREAVIKRKISYWTRSEDGWTAEENIISILNPCRKQGVSFYKYVRDIFGSLVIRECKYIVDELCWCDIKCLGISSVDPK